MAPSKRRNVSAAKPEEPQKSLSRKEMDEKVERILHERRCANEVFDLLELLQAEKERDVLSAVSACSHLFSSLLQRGELHLGHLPKEEDMLAGSYSAEEKYAMFMRHRYNSYVELLVELLEHEAFVVKESSLCALMNFVSTEAQRPLQAVDWDGHCCFPRDLLKAVVRGLLSEKEDTALLISRFQEFLEKDDVRYYTMGAVSDSVGRVMAQAHGVVLPVYQNNVFTLMSNINMPKKEEELRNFLLDRNANREDWKAAKLKEHKRTFERMWLAFLKHKLPSGLYKKVLVVLHDAILPHMSQPTLMIDFLTAAYDIGGAISLLALNGLFVLIHQHNLDYPDFYKKLYNLLDPSVFHVKYRARFFHLANLFLSSSHLPVYLVAAFAKRLSRLALTAPPAALIMILPFICNLIRRHPACRVLIHRPDVTDEPRDDPFLMEEKDPALCHAMESSLWELQTLQKHYHPDVVRVATVINKPLGEQENELSELLELSGYELFERNLQQELKDTVALEFEPVTQLLQGSGGLLDQHFSLE
ncbi:nucleolar complex protein 4-like [Scleropages formosus]|uniref:Nucleolar complex protein 4-like n=1 Tax=Scleropages formosus TaxID=113540 RepID=A0A0P7YL92_SCLFO|nr:nucleolar complex protein 4-like [Scleropages formosus]